MSVLPQIDLELKSLIPPLTAEERDQLEQNILAKRKCHDAIILWNGMILDGHNRFDICVKYGIEFEVREIQLPSKEAAKLWIIENQMGRRNLNEAMRIEMTLAKAEILRAKAKKKLSQAGGDKSKGAPLTEMTSSNDAINVRTSHAKDADVSEGILQNYLQIKAQAHPSLLAQVQAGEVKIGTAHRMLTSEIMKKLDQADKMYKFISRAIPPEGLKAANPSLHGKLAGLADALRVLTMTLAKEEPC